MSLFSLQNKVAVVTGGAGLLGIEHGIALRDAGATVILLDVSEVFLKRAVDAVGLECCIGIVCDITNKVSIESVHNQVLAQYGKVDILVNNAARNPKVEKADDSPALSRFEKLDLADWNLDIAVGLTGAMLCSQIFGGWMAKNGGGVIVNIGSEYSLVAPDQTIYRIEGLPEDQQPSKPVTYTVVKHAIVGLTKHLAVYWAKNNVRVNCLCPGGVEQNQDPAFKEKLTRLIPMGHMAPPDHTRGALVFLCSDASAFMTGEIVAVNGGRTAW